MTAFLIYLYNIDLKNIFKICKYINLFLLILNIQDNIF